MQDQPRIERVSSPLPAQSLDPEDDVIAGTRGFTPQALRLFLACSRQIALGLAHALSQWWRWNDPVQTGFAERMLVQVELEHAIIERFWRTLTDLLGSRHWPPLTAAHLAARTKLALAYYAHLRPHQGLAGACLRRDASRQAGDARRGLPRPRARGTARRAAATPPPESDARRPAGAARGRLPRPRATAAGAAAGKQGCVTHSAGDAAATSTPARPRRPMCA
jgi:hypothetical protein